MVQHSKFSRRDVLRALAAVPPAAGLLGAAAARADEARTQQIAPGIFSHRGQTAILSSTNRGDIANASFIIGDDAVAVIDTGSNARFGAELREAIRAQTQKPVRYVINTHMHPDHVLGNAAFLSDAPQFFAHYKMPAALSARADRYLRNARDALGEEISSGTKVILPAQTVNGKTTLDLGQRTLELRSHRTAHTDNDLSVFDSKTQTLFLGDLLFSGHVPTLDGSILGWLKLIAELRLERAERVVPGHGPETLPWPSSLDPLQHYLEVIVADVRAAINANVLVGDAAKTAGQSEREKWEIFDEHHVRNVTAAFAELEWENQ